MATKENFNKAVFDMFGVGNDTSASQPAAPQSVPQPAAAPVRPASVSYTPATRPSVTYIAPGSYMEGTLKVKGDVEIAGDFKGEMTASGNVVVHSNVSSNITAARLDLIACKLTGDIHASGTVQIDEQSSVAGNIYAEDLSCAGKVKGDIQIGGNTLFQQRSKVEGNITTGTMTMERGAIISGALSMTGIKPEAEKPAEPAESAAETPAADDGGAVVHAIH